VGWDDLGGFSSLSMNAAATGANVGVEAGFLLRRFQGGEHLGLPDSRPMPVIGDRCHELRISEGNVTGRVFSPARPHETAVDPLR
jgi:hypothetical protein